MRLHWSWLFDSPLLMSVLIAAVLVAVAASWTISALRRADAVNAEAQHDLARICAEEAALLWCKADPQGAPIVFRIAGAACQVVHDPGQACLNVTVTLPPEHRFRCDLLAGGAPAAFGLPFAMASTRPVPTGILEPVRLGTAALPVPQIDKRPWSPAQNQAFTRDRALALLRLPTGTDRDDFVLGQGTEQLQLLAPRDGLLLFEGNLWLDAGDPLTVELSQDLTVVVRGNLYVGRSLRVQGPGRLLFLVQAAPGLPFADRDGNGRWSPGDELLADTAFTGPMEGAGSVWLGLPGLTTDALVFDAGIEACGELHLQTTTAVSGPLLLHHGITVLRRAAGLRATGERLPDVARCRIPGFKPEGLPRPGPPIETRGRCGR